MKRRKGLVVVLSAVVFLVVSSKYFFYKTDISTKAAVVELNASGDATTDTAALANAINASVEGDVISLNGTFAINNVIDITGKNLTITGTGVLNGDINGDNVPDTSRLFSISNSDVTIMGVTVTNFNTFGAESVPVTGTNFDTFKDNSSPITVTNNSTIRIAGGTFTKNIGKIGGVISIYGSGSSMKITGGEFSYNKAKEGGAINVLDGASLTVESGKFIGNKAEAGGAIISGIWEDCRNATNQKSAQMTITGGLFQGNIGGVTNDGWEPEDETGSTIFASYNEIGNKVSLGGGAIWSSGHITVAGGTYTENKALRSLGGALFVNACDDNKIIAGEFYNNISYKEGGAIYTEENSTTYFGKTCIYNNQAGHFGGGIWCCPSAHGYFNTLGFAAIFDNSAQLVYDKNLNDNQSDYKHKEYFIGPEDKYPTPAFIGGRSGDDFAMMYKNKPNGENNSIMNLSSHWFTNAPVLWTDDGRPAKKATGYSYMGYQWEDGNYYTESGFGVETEPLNPTFSTSGTDVKFEVGADGRDHALGIKAYGFSNSDKETAKSKAKLKIYNNNAYWCGGGIGSNGKMIFQQFGILSWKKLNEASSSLAGSTWTLTIKQSGNVIDEMEVTDNGSLDEDKTDGVFKVTGLPGGSDITYVLKEKYAPSGYRLDGNEYTKQITEQQSDGSVPETICYIGQDDAGSIYNYHEGTAGFVVNKKMSDESAEVPAYSFTLSPVSALDASGNPVTDENGNEISVPMPAVATVSNTTAPAGGTGVATFGQITYVYPGIYTYKIVEDSDTSKEISVVVTVTYNTESSKLVIDVKYDGSTSIPTIVNNVTPPDNPPTPDNPPSPDNPPTPDNPPSPEEPDNPPQYEVPPEEPPAETPPPQNPPTQDTPEEPTFSEPEEVVGVSNENLPLVEGASRITKTVTSGEIKGAKRSRNTSDIYAEVLVVRVLLIIAALSAIFSLTQVISKKITE